MSSPDRSKPVPRPFPAHLAREDLQRRALPDTVRPYETQHLTRSRGRQSMQLERVGRVSMGHLRVEVGRQVEDLDGIEWAPDEYGRHKRTHARAHGVNGLVPGSNVGEVDETYFFTQIPQPIHRSSEMNAFLSVGLTSIQSFPILTTGHDFLHSCRL